MKRRRGAWVSTRSLMARLAGRVPSLILVHGSSPSLDGAAPRCGPSADPDGNRCALCHIVCTGRIEKPEWRRLRAELAVSVEEVQQHTANQATLAVCPSFPGVVAVAAGHHDLLLGPDALRACRGSVRTLREQLSRSALAYGFRIF